MQRILSLLSEWFSDNPAVFSVYAKKPVESLTPGFSDLDLYCVVDGFQNVQFYRDIGQLCSRLNTIQKKVVGKRLLDNPPFCLPETSFFSFCTLHPWSVSTWQLLCGTDLREETSPTTSREEIVQKLLVAHVLHGDDAANFCVLAPFLLRASPKKIQKINRTAIKIAYNDPLSLASECGQHLPTDKLKDKIEEISSVEYKGRQDPAFYVDLLLFWRDVWDRIFGKAKFSFEPVKGRKPPPALSRFCQNNSHVLGGVWSVLHSNLPYNDVQVVFFIIDPDRESELKSSLCTLAERFFCSFEPHVYAKFITKEQLASYCTAWPWELAAVRETCSVVFGDASILDCLPIPDVHAVERQGAKDFFPFYFTSPLTGFEYLENSKKLALMRYYQYLLFGNCLGKYMLLNQMMPSSPSHMISLFAEKNPGAARHFEKMYHLFQNMSADSLPVFEQTWSTLFSPVQHMFQEVQRI